MKNIVKNYEKENGTLMLLKKCISVINRILVDKKIVTDDELMQYFKKEIK